MKLVIQRVQSGKVSVEGKSIAAIGKGYVVLVAAKKGDQEPSAQKLAEKLLHLRVFSDDQGKMNNSILEERGAVLLVPQFTLYADTKGRRPGFTEAEEPGRAKNLFHFFVEKVKKSGLKVVVGEFGAHMLVEIHNDGPVTIILEE